MNNNIDFTNKNSVFKFLQDNIKDLFKKYRLHDGEIPWNAYQVHTTTEKYDYLNLSKNLYLYLKRKNPNYKFKSSTVNIKKFIHDKLLEFYKNYNKHITNSNKTNSNIGNKTIKLFNNNSNNNSNIGNKTRKLFNNNSNNNSNNTKLIFINQDIINKINTVLDRLNNQYAQNKDGANILFMLILDYISLQIPELQKEYADMFIKDCGEAYNGGIRLSCPQGVSERIIQTLQSILNLKQNINELEQKMLCNFFIIDKDNVLEKALKALNITRDVTSNRNIIPTNSNNNNALNIKRNNYNNKMIRLLKQKMFEQNKNEPCITQEFINNIKNEYIQKFINNRYNYNNTILGGKSKKIRKSRKSKKQNKKSNRKSRKTKKSRK